MNEDNLTGILNHFFRRKPRLPLASNEGIVTATDSHHFIGLQMLYSTLMMTHECKVAVCDLGMDKRQLSWCSRQRNLIVMGSMLDKLRTNQQMRSPKWNKPYALYVSPFEKSLWMDADTVVLDDLEKLFDILEREPVVFSGKEEITPDNAFFMRMPEQISTPYWSYYPNTAVLGINRARDFWLLRDWLYAIELIESNHKIFSAARHYDASALGWALAKNDRLGLAMENTIYNFSSQIGRLHNLPLVYGSPHEMLASMKSDFPIAHVVHFSCPKPWILWDHSGYLNIEPHY